MNRRMFSFALALGVFTIGASCIIGQERKKGTMTGEIKSSKVSPNGKNTILEVLAPGEEKARTYRVQYDPTIKAPLADVLKAVRAAKVGDTCTFDWVDTGEGLAITKFEVIKKKS